MSLTKRLLIPLAIVIILATALFYYSKWLPREQLSREAPRVTPGYFNKVEIYVLVDNNEYDGFKAVWGLSILVVAGNVTILFDTGPSANDLVYNARLLGIDLSHIDYIVISHEHMDHIGGLKGLAKVTECRRVYVPAGMSNSVKSLIRSWGYSVVEVSNTITLCPGVYIIGQLYGPPWEQALAINVSGKAIVIVGCSHPGVDKFVEKVKSELGLKVYMVLGGFHLIGKNIDEVKRIIERLLELGVEKIAPIHCSGDLIRSILKNEYSSHYMEVHVGSKIIVGN